MQVWCTLKFKTCVFSVPVQVLCTLQLKPSVCFVPVQVSCTLKFKTCVFFLPVQVWRTLKFKTQCNCSFLLWYCFYCLQMCSWHMCHFLHPMQLLEGWGAFFVQRVHNLKINWTLFRNRFCFQDIGFFSFEMSICLKSFAFRMYFLLVFGVFLNMWLYWLFSYLAWWTHLEELESALGGGVTIYIYYIYFTDWIRLKYTMYLQSYQSFHSGM